MKAMSKHQLKTDGDCFLCDSTCSLRGFIIDDIKISFI